MNKKLKKLKKFCDAYANYQNATKNNNVLLLESAKNEYTRKLKKMTKMLLNRKPTQEELALLVGEENNGE